jgi:hypothetical protein
MQCPSQRSPCPIVPFPSLESLVVCCHAFVGGDEPSSANFHPLLHECVDLLSSIRPSHITFQPAFRHPRIWPDWRYIDRAAWSTFLNPPSSFNLVSVTLFSSIMLLTREQEKKVELCSKELRWTWDFSSLVGVEDEEDESWVKLEKPVFAVRPLLGLSASNHRQLRLSLLSLSSYGPLTECTLPDTTYVLCFPVGSPSEQVREASKICRFGLLRERQTTGCRSCDKCILAM